MRKLLLWILLCCLPVGAEISQEISRACRRDPAFYRACIRNLEGQYRPGYRAFDLFAYLEKTGPLSLKTGPGALVETGFPLDLALDGPGFFLLSGGRLIRSGAFRIRQGLICTEQGYPLLSSPGLQPLRLEGEATALEVSPDGDLSYIRMDGDGHSQKAGRLALVQLPHPRWLSQQDGILTTTPASGPWQLQPGKTRVLSRQLELGNASPLEQQKACRGVFAFAGLGAAGTSSQARRDLLRVIAEHDARCSASLANLKHLTDAGYRASDVLTRRLRVAPGLLRETRDPYHLAIDGEGYFLLENGLLTRDGSFQMNRQGYLASQDGIKLMGVDGPLKVPVDMSNIEIKGDGVVMGTRLNGDGKPEYVSQITLARVRDGAYLERCGTHLRITPNPDLPNSAEYQAKAAAECWPRATWSPATSAPSSRLKCSTPCATTPTCWACPWPTTTSLEIGT
jgi:flagellar basal body rod protein FlgG